MASEFFFCEWKGDNFGAMEALFILGAYLLGATPFAILISRAMGLPDPRGYGSGNPGATNVARGGGRGAAILTLFADAAKGALPAWLGAFFFGAEIAALAGVAAVVGHAFPVFLKFKGGKGVAAGLGAFSGWNPAACALTVAAWVLIFRIWRISSVASLGAMATAVVLFGIFAAESGDWTAAAGAACVAGLVAIRHRQNISDLIRGKERSFRGGEDGK